MLAGIWRVEHGEMGKGRSRPLHGEAVTQIQARNDGPSDTASSCGGGEGQILDIF